MMSNASFSCFLVLLIILPIFGKNIVNDYERTVEIDVKQVLPTGMDVNAYNNMVLNYWTPERMKSAKPMDLLVRDKISHLKTVNRGAARQISIPGVLPKSLTASSSVVGMLYTRLGSSDYACTASVIASENGDTLFTAAQCIWDSVNKTWTSNVAFVPGYSNGSAPYGVWVWRTVAAMNGWTQYQDDNYDVAIVLLSPSTTGQHVQDLTGSLGMTVNAQKQAQTVAYGYSENVESGQKLASCSGLATPAVIPALPEFQGVELPCSLTNGAGGGPWTQDGSFQTSVNSFVYQGSKVCGPYFGNAVLSLWEKYERQDSI